MYELKHKKKANGKSWGHMEPSKHMTYTSIRHLKGKEESKWDHTLFNGIHRFGTQILKCRSMLG